MKEKYNLKSIIAGFIVSVMGIGFILLDLFYLKTDQNLWISIGCSLIASGLVIFLNALLVERVQYNPLDEWGIKKIYSTRAEKNADSDPKLDKAQYCVDAVAFGLKSFRTKQEQRVENCLNRGVNFRILTMDPASPFLGQREFEEKESPGQIKNTITQLVEWANEKNRRSRKGKIVVKGYSCMTLDFYWRIDDDIFIGPYWYGVDSQLTITYKFEHGGQGFSQYADYFERLWNDPALSKPLTEVVETPPQELTVTANPDSSDDPLRS